MRVELTKIEFNEAKIIGRLRYEKARSNNLFDNKVGHYTNEEIDLNGAAAEIAAAKLLNVYPDKQVEILSQYDLKSKNGFTIDVKTTHHDFGSLLVTPKKKDMPCDFYMLMVGSESVFECRGFSHKDSVFHPDSLGEMYGRKVYKLAQDQLIKYDAWIDLYNR